MAAEPSIRGRPSPVSEGPHQARRHDRFRAASSPAISASFFARVQRFNCRSRVSASSRQSCVTVAKWSRQLHCRLSAALIGATLAARASFRILRRLPSSPEYRLGLNEARPSSNQSTLATAAVLRDPSFAHGADLDLTMPRCPPPAADAEGDRPRGDRNARNNEPHAEGVGGLMAKG